MSKHFGAQKHQPSRFGLEAGESVGLAGPYNGAQASPPSELILGLITPPKASHAAGRAHRQPAGAQLRSKSACERRATHPSLQWHQETLNFAKLKKQPLTKTTNSSERVGISQAARRRVGTYSKVCANASPTRPSLLVNPYCCLTDPPQTRPASRQMF